MKQRKEIWFAHRYNKPGSIAHGLYTNIFTHPRIVKMCGEGPIFEVEIYEVEKGDIAPYWGWEDSKDSNTPGEWSMIWPSLVQLQMCFAYGLEAAEKNGDGRRVNFVVIKAF